MLEAITKKNRAELIVQRYLIFSKSKEKKLNLWLDKQINENMPLQYLLASIPFCSIEILVEPPTLIPRLETEYWCNELILKLKKIKGETLCVLDLCTGTGCIGLAIAKEFPHWKIYTTDISKKALQLTKKNMNHNKILNVKRLNTDIYEGIPDKLLFDLIVCNPPYITMEELKSLSPSVKNWEDHRALACGNNGLEIIEKIISKAKQYLRNNKALQEKDLPQILMEIGENQGIITKNLYLKYDFKNIKIQKDLSNKDRIITANL